MTTSIGNILIRLIYTLLDVMVVHTLDAFSLREIPRTLSRRYCAAPAQQIFFVGTAYIEQGEIHGTTMILDGVSYSASIPLCSVILSRMMNLTVVSLRYDSFWSRRVPLFGTYVSRRLLTPTVFPLQ